MHDPRYPRMREILDDGETVGDVKRISSVFSFRGSDDFTANDIRGQAGLEPAGCLGDLGWYCLRASLWAMNWQLPVRAAGRVLGRGEEENSAIMEFSGELDFSGGASAAFYCSFRSPDQKWLNISGRKGNLRVADFIFPAEDGDNDFEIGRQRIARPAGPEMSSAARMFACFAAEVRGDTKDSRWPEISLKTQLLQDACERSSQLGRAMVLDGAAYRPE